MSTQIYKNFVRASEASPVEVSPSLPLRRYISGHDARRIYLDVVSNPSSQPSRLDTLGSTLTVNTKRVIKPNDNRLHSVRQVFLAAQDNNHEAIQSYISSNPEQINMIDEYGWSLLMIACQANSRQTVEVLLKLGIDVSIRDKAGNSANSLLIKQKNVELINLMLNHKSKQKDIPKTERKRKIFEHYECPECQKRYRDRSEHLSSTVHNINLSKGKRPRMWYGIPESNRGYQILIRAGWDRECGLGPEGEGKRYPIKPVMKQDRKGLGALKKKSAERSDLEKIKNIKSKRQMECDLSIAKNTEKNFRRQFYDF